MPDAMVEAHLPETALILGQTALPRERLDRAKALKAVINVETNLLPNIDYQACQERGIWVLTPAGAFASAVRRRRSAWRSTSPVASRRPTAPSGPERSFTASPAMPAPFASPGRPVGIIGFGDLGKNLRELIRPFRSPVKVYDPWLPDDIILRHDAMPASSTTFWRPAA